MDISEDGAKLDIEEANILDGDIVSQNTPYRKTRHPRLSPFEQKRRRYIAIHSTAKTQSYYRIMAKYGKAQTLDEMCNRVIDLIGARNEAESALMP